MLVKFFPRGVGKGRGPVEYITRKDDPNTKALREPAPEIVRGNPEITKQLIDGLDFKYKYNSGVLSFAIEDAPTEQQQQALIDSFEEYAFAGIERENYNTLWVRHTHTGSDRVELHFVTPKVELETGKSLNIAPLVGTVTLNPGRHTGISKRTGQDQTIYPANEFTNQAIKLSSMQRNNEQD